MMGIAEDGLIKSLRVDRLDVLIYATRNQMGQAAAATVADELRCLIAERGRAVGVFASAPSQNEFLAALVEVPDIDWTRVIGFHLDEYLGMNDQAPQSFRRFLIDRLVSEVPHRALSLTIPTLMRCPRLFAIVPGPAKQQAILRIIEGPIETACPASILRRHRDAHLFLDRHSAALLSH